MQFKIMMKKDANFILMNMLLFYPAINNLLWRICFGLTSVLEIRITQSFFDIAVWIFIIIYIHRYFIRRVKARHVMIFITFLLVALISNMLTNYEAFTLNKLFQIILTIFPVFFCGAIIYVDSEYQEGLYISAVIILLVSFTYTLYYLTSGRQLAVDNMDQAYSVLPAILIVFSRLFEPSRNKTSILISILSIMYLLMLGTRGPFLCLAVFVGIMLLKKYGMSKTVISATVAIAIVAIAFESNFVQMRMLNLAKNLEEYGFSSRIVTMLVSRNITDANGRNSIKETLLSDIENEPFQIRGLFADREATKGLYDYEYHTIYANGTYAHNLIIELIYDWGILIGGVLILSLFYGAFKLFYKVDKEKSFIVGIYICLGIVHLLISGSYLENRDFFFLIGLMCNKYLLEDTETLVDIEHEDE